MSSALDGVLGVSSDQAAAALAHALPDAVSHLTPGGHVPTEAEADTALQAPAASPGKD